MYQQRFPACPGDSEKVTGSTWLTWGVFLRNNNMLHLPTELPNEYANKTWGLSFFIIIKPRPDVAMVKTFLMLPENKLKYLNVRSANID